MMQMNEISRAELDKYKKKYDVNYSIGDLAATISVINGVEIPSESGGTPIASVVDQAQRLMDGVGRNQKTLILCPDAVGEIHRQKYPEKLARVKNISGFRILSSAVMPSVTPVCFCTIFSGASPEVHGIHTWEQPVVKIPTIFDTFAAAGKKVAIVAGNTSSMERIFRMREIDYISTRDDETAFRFTRTLMAEYDYDLIVTYLAMHDSNAHHFGCDAPETVAELEKAVSSFEILNADAEKYWKNFNRTLVFAPDHGNHRIDEVSGGHGDDIPEDMLVNHFYRVRSAGK